MEIKRITCGHTNCYLIETKDGLLMIDTGWSETLPLLGRLLKQQAFNLNDIKHLIITHFHPDHAGITQDLKELGVKLILLDTQPEYIGEMNALFKRHPQYKYKNITLEGNIVVLASESRAFLKTLGIDGEIIPTPGHSNDSISVIIDGCCAFTGDLPEPSLIEAFGSQEMNESWELIKSYNVHTIYPAHGESYPI